MIVSFYSYKGGVGRSQLLANLAAYLCFYNNKKILLIDWDLEAPGLHYYFEKSKKIQQKGLIEFLLDYCDFMNQSDGDVMEADIEKQFKANLGQFIAPKIAVSKNGIGQIDIMPAGLYNEQYTTKASNFDWIKFYETLNGGFFLELLKRYLKDKDYDFIFIDSRTGISDYSGICNIQMPDANVVVIAPSAQNVEGSQKVIKSIENAEYITKYHKRFPLIFPILSRLDPRDDHQKARWIRDFRRDFKDPIAHLIGFGLLNDKLPASELSNNTENYISDTLLEYRTDLSYGEQILFDAKAEKIEKTTLAYQIAHIANLLRAYAHYPAIDSQLLPFDATKAAKEVAKFDAIKQRFEQWTAAEKNAENVFNYAVFLHETQRYEAALTQYELAQTLTSNPAKKLKLQNNLALTHKHLGQLDEAHQLFSQLVDQYPQNPDVLFNFAGVLQQQNQPNAALKYYDKALAIYERQIPDKQQAYSLTIAQVLDNQAYCLAQEKDWAAVETCCKKALDIYQQLEKEAPDNDASYAIKVAYHNLALAFLQQKKYAEAIDYHEEVIKAAKTISRGLYDVEFYRTYAKACFDKKQYKVAIDICNEALQITPDDANICNIRGYTYSTLEENDKAIADFSKAIELDTKFAYPYYNRGNAYRNQQKYDQAIADYSKAIDLDLKYAYAYRSRGLAYANQQKYDEAIADYSKAIELDSKFANAYNNRGIAYDDLKEYPKAIADYSKAIELDPKYANAYHNRGNAYYNQQEYAQAIADYSKTIELDPKYATAYYNRGNVYYNQ